MTYGPKPRPIEDRLWEKVNKSEQGCWTWTGSDCDGCGTTEEVVVTATKPDDALLPTVEQFARSHAGMRRPSAGMGRWTINGQEQTR